MRKFYAFLMLLVAFVTGVSAQEAETVLKGYRKASETPSLVNELRGEDLIAIEGRATTNRNWASGAAAWVPANSDGTLPISVAFKLVDAGNSQFYLQQVSTGQYLTKAAATSGAIAMTANQSEAAKFNLIQITGDGNDRTTLGTNQRAEGTDATKCIRFENSDPATYLNCNNTNLRPQWAAGKGMWSAYYVYKVSPINVALKTLTVKHIYNGEVKDTQTAKVEAPLTLEQALTPYKKKLGGMTATVESGTTLVSDATSEVTITYTQTTALPFEFTPEGATNEQAKWYTMQVRDLYVKYDTELLGSDKDFPLSKDANLNENYQFKFVGDPFGFKIYNKAAGTHALGASAGRTAGSTPEDDRYFNIKESETEFVLHLNQDWGLLIKGTAHNYVNCRFIEVNGEKKYYMSSWNSTGAANDSENRTEIGSRVIFAKADESTLYGNLLNQYRAEVKPKVEALAAITVLFSEADKTTAIAGIDQERNVSSEERYNTAKAEINEVLRTFYAKAENKKFILRNRQNNRYLSAEGTRVSTTHFAPTDAFTLAYTGEGKYNLVTHEGKKVQPLTAYNTPATAGDNNGETYTLEANGEYVLFHATTPISGATNQNYLHSNREVNLVAWDNDTPSQWGLEVVADDFDYAARAKELLTAALNLNGKVLGSNLGQYDYVSQAVKDAVTAAQATDATLATVVAGVDKALNPDGNYATTGESLYALNLPKPGQFIRIKSTKGATKYLSSALVAHTRYSGANVLGLKAEADTSTIFYVEEAGKLVAFDNGKSVVNSYGFLSTGDYGTAPTALVITESAGNTGKYRISLGTERTIYADGDATDNHSDAAGGVKTEDGYRFDLEEVTTLPLSALVYSQEDGKYFGTFYTPVAGTVSGGDAEVYYGKVEDDRITLTRVDNNQVAARTAFLVATTTQNAAINFNLGEATPTVAATADNNELVGYTTSVNTANENDYQLSKEEGSFSRVGNYKKRAFRGYLENVSSTAHALAFVLDRTVTRVATAVAETSNAPVFDLAGRRVLQPVKGGIYLQNGKKFIQK